MYSKVSLQLILINDVTKQDDSVSIRKNLTYNEFDLTFIENTPGELPIRFSITGLSHQGALDYVHTLLKSQCVDDEPYTRIQVNAPATPRLIISSEKLKDLYYRDHVYDMISGGLHYLETASVERVVKKSLKVTKAVKIPAAPKKPVVPLPDSDDESESDGEIDYYKSKYDYSACNKQCSHPSPRSTPSGLRPQHLFWDE